LPEATQPENGSKRVLSLLASRITLFSHLYHGKFIQQQLEGIASLPSARRAEDQAISTLHAARESGLVSGVRPDSAIAIRGVDEAHGNRPRLGGKPIYNFSWFDQLDDTRLASNV